jgi:hypothetical protein
MARERLDITLMTSPPDIPNHFDQVFNSTSLACTPLITPIQDIVTHFAYPSLSKMCNYIQVRRLLEESFYANVTVSMHLR